MLSLRPGLPTPPDKYRFLFPDGHTEHAFSEVEWRDKVVKYATDNDYPIPTIEEMEDQLCRTLSGEWCSGGDEYSFVSSRFTFNDFLRGMKTLAEFVVQDEVVSQELAESRALICSRCVLNMDVPGCKSCTGMANAIAEIKGARGTKQDHLLKSCGICHCSNQAQVWVPIERLAKGVDAEMMERYKRVGECWKKSELANLTETA